MNVFVLCTGRNGSVTFSKASAHARNFTAGHETRMRIIGPERFDYPQHHIEADNRLSWLLGRLDRAYGDRAWYVHLIRDPEEVALSFNRRWHVDGGIIRAYRDAIHMNTTADGLLAARDYVDTVTENIRCFLRDKAHAMEVRVERAHEDFRTFWRWIGAEGNLDAALAEWDVRHNESHEVQPPPPRNLAERALEMLRLKH